MSNPNDPTRNTDTAWEEAMSRDFDARVRDLHEAPLDISSVKGKAHKIQRNRRAAVAGGILGVAAIITPVAVLANGNGDTNGKEPDFAPQTTETVVDPTEGLDYVQNSVWHQADGDVVPIAKGDYNEAGLWDGKLVTLQSGGEVYSTMTIFDDDGSVFNKLDDILGFAVSADGAILSYTNAEGDLIARWDGNQQSVLATGVTDTGGGESVGGAPVAVTGTPPCAPESGNCLVRIDTYEDGCRGIGSSDVPAPVDALSCGDEQDDLLVYVTHLTPDEGYPCAGVGQGSDRALLWPATCDYDLQDLSPDGQYVVGGQIDSDGLGPKTVSILDVATGTEVTSYTAPTDSAFLWSDIAWSMSGHLLVSEWDGGQWHLLAIDPATEDVTEVAGPVPGDEVSNPFLLIHH